MFCNLRKDVYVHCLAIKEHRKSTLKKVFNKLAVYILDDAEIVFSRKSSYLPT